MSALLQVDNISKRFGGFVALDGNRVCAARCRGLRTQRDCPHDELLDRQLEVATPQGAPEAAGALAQRKEGSQGRDTP